MAVIVTIKDIDGNVHTLNLEWDTEKSIVDLAEDQWIELPYSCRSGACFSCCAEVTSGQEFLNPEKTGEALIDVEPNECLTCICGVNKKAFEAYEAGETVEIGLEMMN